MEKNETNFYDYEIVVCDKCFGTGDYWDSEDECIDECSMCGGAGKRKILKLKIKEN
jgi:DnaJ-class molecular chaperone